MDRAMRNMIKFLSISIPQAVVMAAQNPAKLLGFRDRGKIAEGYRADIVIFDEKINIDIVFKSGKRVK